MTWDGWPSTGEIFLSSWTQWRLASPLYTPLTKAVTSNFISINRTRRLESTLCEKRLWDLDNPCPTVMESTEEVQTPGWGKNWDHLPSHTITSHKKQGNKLFLISITVSAAGRRSEGLHYISEPDSRGSNRGKIVYLLNWGAQQKDKALQKPNTNNKRCFILWFRRKKEKRRQEDGIKQSTEEALSYGVFRWSISNQQA